MTQAKNRFSVSSDHDGSKKPEMPKEMWSTMLDRVASGKSLSEKNIIMLGGTPELQRDFLASLSNHDSKPAHGFQNRMKPPTANHLALGYTYHDVLDADHEDTLARLSIFLLTDPSPSFTPLLQPLLTPKTISNTLVVILLDWSVPWNWLRQLQAWIQLLRKLLLSLDQICKEKMEEVMFLWRDKGRGIKNFDSLSTSTFTESDLNLPLGSGEWDIPLGIPLCVVCQNSDRIELLEKECGWKEEQFDFVLQSLRTILLKHGASLIYTLPSATGDLQSLLHSSLGIHSLLKRQPLKHNVVDRDKVLIPPNWDSWGKIKVLREGFDVEAVSQGWSLDIEEESTLDFKSDGRTVIDSENIKIVKGAVELYERVIQDPSLSPLHTTPLDSDGCQLEVECQHTQEFLAIQLEILENSKQDKDSSGMENSQRIRTQQIRSTQTDSNDHPEVETHISEHIGPIQFNMGGIQVNSDEILQRLKDHESHHPLEPKSPNTLPISSQNDALASFFEGLMHRGGRARSPSSPKTQL